MAAAVAGPLLAADIGAFIGLDTCLEQTREEVFAPYCGKWVKVSLRLKHKSLCLAWHAWQWGRWPAALMSNHAPLVRPSPNCPSLTLAQLSAPSPCIKQDKEASESMTSCCQLLGFSTLLQHAIRLIKGLEIQMQNGIISVSVCSFISWFRVRSSHTRTRSTAASAAAK